MDYPPEAGNDSNMENANLMSYHSKQEKFA